MDRRKGPGFTWMEGLIIVSILSVMAAMAIPMWKQYQQRQEPSLKMEEVTPAGVPQGWEVSGEEKDQGGGMLQVVFVGFIILAIAGTAVVNIHRARKDRDADKYRN